jgi:hypothetical protein
MRPGRVTVVGPVGPEAADALREEALRVGARLLDALSEVEVVGGTDLLDIRTPRRLYRGVRPLPGRHHRDHVVVALRSLVEAEAAGVPVDL